MGKITGFEPFEIGTEIIGSSDLIRRKWLDNDLYVINLSVDYTNKKLKAILGGSWQDYFGRHYGNVVSCKGLRPF